MPTRLSSFSFSFASSRVATTHPLRSNCLLSFDPSCKLLHFSSWLLYPTIPTVSQCRHTNSFSVPCLRSTNKRPGLADSNNALSLSLVSPSKSGLRLVDTFHPDFTYPIFGVDEKIFGYKGLKIGLRFRANDMRPHVQITYSNKLTPSAGMDEPTDVKAVLQEHLPKSKQTAVAFTNSAHLHT